MEVLGRNKTGKITLLHPLHEHAAGASKLFQNIQILLGADAERAQIAFDFEHGKVFLCAHNYRTNQIVPVPNPMIAFLTDQATSYCKKELLKFFVMDGAEGGHGVRQEWEAQ